MDIWVPIILFWIFQGLDLYKTKKGILTDASNEGNPLTAYLYRKTPNWAFSLMHILYALLITLLILFYGSIGLWIGYSATVYNLLGYLSWTRLNKWKAKTNRVQWTPLLLTTAVISGYLLTVIHENLRNV